MDPADHEFILGTTTPSKGLAEVVMNAERHGATGTQIDDLEAEWISKNPLVTFDQGKRHCAKKAFGVNVPPMD